MYGWVGEDELDRAVVQGNFALAVEGVNAVVNVTVGE